MAKGGKWFEVPISYHFDLKADNKHVIIKFYSTLLICDVLINPTNVFYSRITINYIEEFILKYRFSSIKAPKFFLSQKI